MPELVTTWTVTLRRPLGHGEDPVAPGATDAEHLLWAFEEGEVVVFTELVE